MTIRSLSNRRLVFAFGAAVAVLLVVGAFSYRGLVVSRESDRWVRHSHEVLENLDELLFAVASIELSSRGFVLTGEDSYLASDHANISGAEQHLAAVRSLTVDNPNQQRWLPALERLVAQKIQFAEEAINLRRAKGLEAGSNAIRSGQGQRVMDEFQAVVRQLEDEEQRLLAQRDADVKRRLVQTQSILVLGTVLGLLITAAAGWSVQRDSSKRGVAEEATKESAAKYRGLLEAAPDAMVVVNQGGEIVLLNFRRRSSSDTAAMNSLGQKVTNIIPRGFAERLIADDRRTAAEALAQQIGTGIELIGRRKDASEFPIEIMLSPLESPEGVLVTAAIRDISVRKKAEAHLLGMSQQMTYSAEHDFLTGLPNGSLLNDRISQAIASGAASQEIISRSCFWIWTDSSTSTIPWDTRSATSFFNPSQNAWRIACATRTR